VHFPPPRPWWMETATVSADRPHARHRVTFAGSELDRYRHVCAFVHGDEQDAVLDPFVAEGVDEGDRLLFLVDPLRAGAPVHRLRSLGYSPTELLTEGRCEVRTWNETYLRGGDFDQDEMLDLLGELLAERDGQRVRMVADMEWAASDRGETLDDLIEFESRANFIHARHSHVVVCVYDLQRFGGSFVIDVLRTHPVVLIHGALHENPFFVPPEQFVRERARRSAR
jgi:hypothetical protein